MDRRSKVRVGMMMSMALLFIALLLSGGEILAQPRPQGTLRIALPTLAEEGFLPDMGDSNQCRMYPLVFDYPLYFDDKTDEIIPGLAKRFEYSKDNLILTLYLREDVPWQDKEKWGEVTAEDVKYSYERIMGKNSTSLSKAPYNESIKSIEVVNRYTVALRLKQPSPEFWRYLLNSSNPNCPILCKRYVETVGEEKARFQPIGSGPYRSVAHKTGEYLKFEASEKHWRVVPEFKSLIMQVVPEETTMVAMLKSGEIDIARISAQSMADLQRIKGITAIVYPWRIAGWREILTKRLIGTENLISV
jgi:peptide/nickel transport system substrate-binding protein